MYRVTDKLMLNPTVCRMRVHAPLIAKKALPGQFIILRALNTSERIPLTIADTDSDTGEVTIIYQIVGASTEELNTIEAGGFIADFAGPLGRPTELEGVSRVAVVGGGVGCAIAYPVAKAFHNAGVHVHSIVGFRNSDLVILEDEFKAVSSAFTLMSDDGSAGEKGLVTNALEKLIEGGEKFDLVITIGPLIMMKFVAALTKRYGIKTIVSMNPIMIDGTGMCGGCRLTVGGKVCFACVDGPDFDGHEVDFDEAISRGAMYKEFERKKHDEVCNLFKSEVRQ